VKRQVLIVCLAMSMAASFSACSGSSAGTASSGQEETSAENSTAAEKKETTAEKKETAAGTSAAKAEDTAETTAQAAEAKLNYAYTVEKVGEYSDPDKQLQNFKNCPVTVSGGKGRLLTYLGEDKLGKDITGTSYLGQGLYAVRTDADNINSVGLVDQDGNVLIPFEAANIRWPDSLHSSTDRYLKVIYATEKTDNKKEAFFYTTDNQVSFKPDPDDTLYKGYAKIYDLKQKKFFDDIKITNGDQYGMEPCGSGFCIKNDDGTTTLYDENGSSVLQLKGSVSAGNGMIVQSDGNVYNVYDETGKQTWSQKDALYCFDSESGYLISDGGSGSTVLDRNGKEAVPGTFKNYMSVKSEKDGVLLVEKDGKETLIKADGTVIAAAKDADGYFSEVENGIYSDNGTQDSSGNMVYTLVGPDGILCKGERYGTSNIDIIDGTKAFVFDDGDYTLKLEKEDPKVLGSTLIAAQAADTGFYGVFDLYSGKQIIPYDYEKILAINRYIYAYRQNVWTVFKLSGPVQQK